MVATAVAWATNRLPSPAAPAESGARVEMAQHEVTGRGLLDHQRRDQKAADHEEHVGAKEAAGYPRHSDVVQQHADDGERPPSTDFRSLVH